MTRDEVLAEIRRRAHREHGTTVRALLSILDKEVVEIRRHITAPTGSPYSADYAEVMANAADLIEEAVFDVFRVWPSTAEQAPTGETVEGAV